MPNGNALSRLNREKSSLTSEKVRPTSFTGRPTRRSSITGDMGEFLASISDLLYSPPVAGISSGVDIGRFPVTQGMYRGETFDAPTFGTPGVIFPWEILEKRRAAKIQSEKEIESESLALDYEMQEVKDEISNAIFVKNQLQRFDEILAYHTEKFDGDKRKAIYYLNIEDPNILKNEALLWKNFRSLFDKTWDNYVKVITDTDAFGLSKYDEDTKVMADVFANFIANPDMMKPEAIEEYSVFLGAFNERISLVEIAKTASEELKGLWTEDIEKFAEENDYDVFVIRKKLIENFDNISGDYLKMFGGLKDHSEEEKKVFMNVFKHFFINDAVSKISFPDKFNLPDRTKFEQFKSELEPKEEEIIIPNIGHKDINITNEQGELISKAPVEDYHDMSSDPVKFTGKAIGRAYNVTTGKYEDIAGGLTGEIVGVGKLEKSEIDILVPIEETDKQRKNREKRGEQIPTEVLNTLKTRDHLNRIGYVRVKKQEKYKGTWYEYYIVDYISVVSDIVKGEREGKYKFEDFDITGKEKITEKVEEGYLPGEERKFGDSIIVARNVGDGLVPDVKEAGWYYKGTNKKAE